MIQREIKNVEIFPSVVDENYDLTSERQPSWLEIGNGKTKFHRTIMSAVEMRRLREYHAKHRNSQYVPKGSVLETQMTTKQTEYVL